MSKVVLNLDHLDRVRDVAFAVIDGVSNETMDLKKASRLIEAAKVVQHDAKLRLQGAVILGQGETLEVVTSAALPAPAAEAA